MSIHITHKGNRIRFTGKDANEMFKNLASKVSKKECLWCGNEFPSNELDEHQHCLECVKNPAGGQ